MKIQAQDPQTIVRMFGNIASRYDLANSVLSLGIHHTWRRKLVSQCKPLLSLDRKIKILDCATGTGDLAFEFESFFGKRAEVLGLDFCEPMIDVAKKKASNKKSSVKFKLADVLCIPFEDDAFDVASIAFGIRNTSDPSKALIELARVVRPGGSVFVLEFGQPRQALFSAAYRFYSKRVLPLIGGVFSGNSEAYRYLEQSSGRFPSGEEFLSLAKDTRVFSELRSEVLQGGIVHLYELTVATSEAPRSEALQ